MIHYREVIGGKINRTKPRGSHQKPLFYHLMKKRKVKVRVDEMQKRRHRRMSLMWRRTCLMAEYQK